MSVHFCANFRLLLLLLLSLMLAACKIAPNVNKTQQSDDQIARSLIAAAEDALYSVAQDEQIGALFLNKLGDMNIAGVIITPNLIKGGLFVGGSGGEGVLLGKATNGEWSYPSFVQQGSGSFGLQIGFQSSKVVSIIGSTEQLRVMLRGSPMAGGEAGGTIINEGVNIDIAGGLDVSSALRSFAVSKGAFVGADVKLGGLWTDARLNRAFYGTAQATPENIVMKAQFQNAAADRLRNLLMRFSN